MIIACLLLTSLSIGFSVIVWFHSCHVSTRVEEAYEYILKTNEHITKVNQLVSRTHDSIRGVQDLVSKQMERTDTLRYKLTQLTHDVTAHRNSFENGIADLETKIMDILKSSSPEKESSV